MIIVVLVRSGTEYILVGPTGGLRARRESNPLQHKLIVLQTILPPWENLLGSHYEACLNSLFLLTARVELARAQTQLLLREPWLPFQHVNVFLQRIEL